MTVERYLQSIRKFLRLPREKADDIIAEIHAHLLEDIRHHEQNGLPKHVAVQRACQEFGRAHDVAREFMKSSVGFFRTPLRIIIVTLLALVAITMMRRAAYGIPVFENALAPLYTDEWAFFLIEALLSYLIAAVFLFRRLQRIARSAFEFRRLLIVAVTSVFALDLVRNIVPDALNNFSVFYINPTTQVILQAILSEMISQGVWIIITMIFPIFLLLSMPTRHRVTISSLPSLVMSAGILVFLTSGVLALAFKRWCLDKDHFVEGCPASVSTLDILTMSLALLGPIAIALFIAKKIEQKQKCDRMET